MKSSLLWLPNLNFMCWKLTDEIFTFSRALFASWIPLESIFILYLLFVAGTKALRAHKERSFLSFCESHPRLPLFVADPNPLSSFIICGKSNSPGLTLRLWKASFCFAALRHLERARVVASSLAFQTPATLKKLIFIYYAHEKNVLRHSISPWSLNFSCTEGSQNEMEPTFRRKNAKMLSS